MRHSLLLSAILLAACTVAVAKEKEQTQVRAGLSESGRVSIGMAQQALENGHPTEAEALARKALASDGGNARVHALMGMIQARLQRQDKARAEFVRALDLAAGDGTVYNLYGVWQCENGDAAGADQSFQTALRMRGMQRGSVLANAGRCASQAHDWARARDYLREGVALWPTDRNVLLLLAEAELQLGQTLEARAFAQRSDALGPDANTLALAARVEDAAGDKVSAARYRQRLRDEFPGYAPIGEGSRQQ